MVTLTNSVTIGYSNFEENMDNLTYLEIKAADMYARGAKEPEILEACQRTRNWFRTLKKKETFRKYVNEQIDKYQSQDGATTSRIMKTEVDIFREDFKKASELLYTASLIGINKLIERIELLDISEIRTHDIPKFLDSLNRAVVTSLEVRQASLGLNQLLEYADDFKQIVETRAIEFREGESNLTTTEET
jgi:hypothetical protein